MALGSGSKTKINHTTVLLSTTITFGKQDPDTSTCLTRTSSVLLGDTDLVCLYSTLTAICPQSCWWKLEYKNMVTTSSLPEVPMSMPQLFLQFMFTVSLNRKQKIT